MGPKNKKDKTDLRKLCTAISCPYRHEYQHNIEFRHDVIFEERQQFVPSGGFVLGGSRDFDRSNFLSMYEQRCTENNSHKEKQTKKRSMKEAPAYDPQRRKIEIDSKPKIDFSDELSRPSQLSIQEMRSLSTRNSKERFIPVPEVPLKGDDIVEIAFILPTGKSVSHRFWISQTLQVRTFIPLFSDLYSSFQQELFLFLYVMEDCLDYKYLHLKSSDSLFHFKESISEDSAWAEETLQNLNILHSATFTVIGFGDKSAILDKGQSQKKVIDLMECILKIYREW